MISILDYGAGNLRSVENTLHAIGADYELVQDTAGLRRASKIILPGVGHFGQMMRSLDEIDVRETLLERIRAGVPFLGVCLGLQALFDSSEEAPEARGWACSPVALRSLKAICGFHTWLGFTRTHARIEAALRYRRGTVCVFRKQFLCACDHGSRGELHVWSAIHGCH